jgi:hypothetical protein
LAQLTDIPPDEQILISSNGDYLQHNELIIESGKKATFGTVSEVFLFDRRIMKGSKELPCLEFEITESKSLSLRLTISKFICYLVDSLESDDGISAAGPLSSIPSDIILSYAHVLIFHMNFVSFNTILSYLHKLLLNTMTKPLLLSERLLSIYGACKL